MATPLYDRQPDGTGADNQYRVVGAQVGAAHRIVTNRQRLHGRSFFVADVGGQSQGIWCADGHIFGVGAVDLVSETNLPDIPALVPVSELAGIALATDYVDHRKRPIADGPALDGATDGDDLAREFVAHNDVVWRPVGRGGMQIAATDTNGFYTHEQLLFPDVGHRPVLDDERLALLLEYCCLHPAILSSVGRFPEILK